jgi:hypothetical protein
MFGFGLPEIVIIVTVLGFLAVIAGGVFGRGRVSVSGPTLVLTQFRVDENGREGYYVDAEGRPSGILAALASVIGAGTPTHLRLSAEDLSIRTEGLSGSFVQTVLLDRVSSAHCGYSRSIILLVLGILTGAFGLYRIIHDHQLISNRMVSLYGYLPLIVLALIFFIAYSMSRRILIAVETRGGMILGIKFKPGVLDGEQINFNDAERAIALIDQLIKRKSAVLASDRLT